ncbi:maleate cis-trans isomerase family protein [Marivita hallyeonensis]|uniref:Maleate isomerase n=1 Tax=Marivita hallyeonensis TaxID=996342 RepID=A0A1M5PHH3_9RHOB|nr:aspartate/glutamate racemase family protein [Marivita hallyeonensis]SHH00693.1 maleate isomerase [Marivita hallyeonensis]
MALPYTLETDRPLQVGVLALQADESLEPDLRRMIPDDVEYLVSRVPSDVTVSRETLRAMEGRITGAASLLPRGAEIAAVAYGCTSASAEIGSERVGALVQAGVATPYVTEPLSAVIAACRALQVTRIGVISPYVEAVSDQLRHALSEAGLKVTAFASFEEAEEARVVRIAPASLEAAAVEMGRSETCDAVFLSCTNLRTLDVIEVVEERIGKPVLSSNQALIWHLAQLAGFADRVRGVGRVFATTLAR